MSHKIIFVLDNVRSAFNVGSIFRTADGLGAEVELIGITPIPGIDKKLDKTSLSSLESVEWRYFDTREMWYKHSIVAKEQETRPNLLISVEEKQELKGISLFDISTAINYSKFGAIYLIFGHEINGVNDFLINKSDYVLTIPMYGTKNSLNIATCIGIVGYRIKEELLFH